MSQAVPTDRPSRPAPGPSLVLTRGYLLRVVAHWLPLAVTATLLAGLAYLAVQQAIRLGANDPQVQIAEDTAAALADGTAATALVGERKVDLSASLAGFVIVFDEAGRPLAGSAELDGRLPLPPPGVFDQARRAGQNRFTWQPGPGVRTAAVLVHHAGARSGFVLAGRSLREAEARIDTVTLLVGVLWLATLGGSLVAVAAAVALRLWVEGSSSRPDVSPAGGAVPPGTGWLRRQGRPRSPQAE